MDDWGCLKIGVLTVDGGSFTHVLLEEMVVLVNWPGQGSSAAGKGSLEGSLRCGRSSCYLFGRERRFLRCDKSSSE